MSKILEVMKSNRNRAEAAEIGITDRVYKAMMEDARDELRTKAVAEARMSVQGELSTAQAAASAAKAETAQIGAKLAQAEAQVVKATAELGAIKQSLKLAEDSKKSLEKIIKIEQGTLTAKDLEYKRQIQELEVALRDVKGERHDLEVENSRLKGKLEAAPKPSKASKPREIPDFELEVAQRGGPGDRIQKVRIKPVRMK